MDWRAELLEAVHRVFTRERSVFKSALYTYLDPTDTSDAIIHINQLERRMAEQVTVIPLLISLSQFIFRTASGSVLLIVTLMLVISVFF